MRWPSRRWIRYVAARRGRVRNTCVLQARYAAQETLNSAQAPDHAGPLSLLQEHCLPSPSLRPQAVNRTTLERSAAACEDLRRSLPPLQARVEALQRECAQLEAQHIEELAQAEATPAKAEAARVRAGELREHMVQGEARLVQLGSDLAWHKESYPLTRKELLGRINVALYSSKAHCTLPARPLPT